MTFNMPRISATKDMLCRVFGGIPKHAFYEISNYESDKHKDIRIEDDYIDTMTEHPIIKIGRKGLAYHKELKSIFIKTSISYFGEEAFKDCENLENIYFGNSVKEIALNAFDGCKKLKNIYFAGTEEEFKKINVLKETVSVSSTGHGGTFYRGATHYNGNDIIYDCNVYFNCKLHEDSYFYNQLMKAIKCTLYVKT